MLFIITVAVIIIVGLFIGLVWFNEKVISRLYNNYLKTNNTKRIIALAFIEASILVLVFDVFLSLVYCLYLRYAYISYKKEFLKKKSTKPNLKSKVSQQIKLRDLYIVRIGLILGLSLLRFIFNSKRFNI